jgi:hypothetical protein
LQLLARHYLACAFQQHKKHQEGLALEPDAATVSDQLTRRKIEFEIRKPRLDRLGD